MSAVGSWAWAQKTGGRLGRADRAELLRQGVLARLSNLPRPWRRGLIPDGTSSTMPVAPDTALAREAEDRVRELSSPVLYGHCLRTWAFAELFAQRDRVAHDEELLYVACVLHDLGLTETYDGRDATAKCFAVEGARAAHAVVSAHGHPAIRADTVAEAISLHLNIDVHVRYGPVATLLSKGVMLDVVGRRLEQLPPEPVADIVARWPRAGSGELLLADTKRQAQQRPHSRAALLHKLGFTALVSANPLDHP
ncbi:MAG: HD domain-containing protein [Mycobacterium sp.]